MPKTIRVALAQMCSTDNLKANLIDAEKWIAEASKAGASLVVLPEYFYYMGAADRLPEIAEEQGKGLIQDRISAAAREAKIHVLAGSTPLKTNNERIASSALLFTPEGKIAARYDKMHLFDMVVPRSGEIYRESDQIQPGSSVVNTQAGELKLGLSICYDLRFPELFRALMENGAEVLCVPAAFTYTTGKAHWHTLIRARAIENQCYVLAAGQGGNHPDNKRTFGHSLVVDPWGEVIVEGPAEGAKLLIAELDLEKLRDLRRDFPVLKHRLLETIKG